MRNVPNNVHLMSGLDFTRALMHKEFSVPFQDKLGAYFTKVDVGYVEMVLPLQDDLTNSFGLLNGGVHSAIADFCVTFAVRSHLPPGKSSTTLSLHIDFMRAQKEFIGKVYAVGKVTKPGSQIYFAESCLKANGDRILSKSTATLKVTEIKEYTLAPSPQQ